MVDTIIDYSEFVRDTNIGTDLDSAFKSQASLFAFYAGKYHKASLQADKFETLMKIAEAKIGKDFRDLSAKEGTKITEKMVEAHVITQPAYIKAKMQYHEARGISDLVKNCLDSLRQRRDMLIQLGANEREERKGDMAMMANPVAAYRRGLEKTSE